MDSVDMDMDLGEDRGYTQLQATQKFGISRTWRPAREGITKSILLTNKFLLSREELRHLPLRVTPLGGEGIELVAHSEQLRMLRARMLARINADVVVTRVRRAQTRVLVLETSELLLHLLHFPQLIPHARVLQAQ